MGIGFSIFLFVIGAILTFAVEVDTGSGFNLNTVGIILMVGGLLGLLVSALFWSSFSPWSRRRLLHFDPSWTQARPVPSRVSWQDCSGLRLQVMSPSLLEGIPCETTHDASPWGARRPRPGRVGPGRPLPPVDLLRDRP